MKEKIISILNKEINIPIPERLKNSRLGFLLSKMPNRREIVSAAKTLSQKEKVVFWSFVALFAVSTLLLCWQANQALMVEIPASGGTLTEGVSDVPRFINPLLVTGEADRDIAALVYSGLVRVSQSGNYIPDLAESYEISQDGLRYSFKIREDAVWHDGRPVTTEDIAFTIEKAKDPVLRSPKKINWEGVTIEILDEKNIVFSLKQPYSSFLENATLGILPKHLWQNIETKNWVHSEYNLKGVGSGPYKVRYVSKQNTPEGLPEYIELTPFSEYTLGEPRIKKIIVKFYPSREKLVKAYDSGEVESMNSISPPRALELENSGTRIEKIFSPTTFAVFFNGNDAKALSETKVRIALDTAVDKKKIIEDVLLGYGSPLFGQIPPGSLGYTKTNTGSTSPEDKILEAKNLLTKAGWKFNAKIEVWEKKISGSGLVQLDFSLSTPDIPEIKKVAEMIKGDWEKLGAKVTLKVFEKGDLDKNVIQPRKYDALLFGEVLGRDPDVFSFWHSSQRNYPGVNITMYVNSIADKYLETTRTETNMAKKLKAINDLDKELKKDMPASFIYSPYFIYAVPSKVKNVKLVPPITASDRFLNVYEWYIDSEKIWKIFAPSAN